MAGKDCPICALPVTKRWARYCSNRCSRLARGNTVTPGPWPGCGVDGCEDMATSFRGRMCWTHYQRQRKGKALHQPPPRNTLPCVVEGCTAKVQARGMCYTHWSRWRRHGSPTVVMPPSGPPIQEEVGYSGAHDRVARVKGRAKDHECVDCGAPALEWSYNHDDPDERMTTRPRCPYPVPYSMDPEHYSARCGTCHRLHDNAAASARRL